MAGEKEKIKTLANCKPSEFLRQTNLIRKSVERWFDVTEIMEIRKRSPHIEVAPAGATVEEINAVLSRNKEAEKKQMKENFSAILESVLELHPDETLEVLALCCFMDPQNVDDHPVSFYLTAINDLLNDEAVMGFFISLVQLERTFTRQA